MNLKSFKTVDIQGEPFKDEPESKVSKVFKCSCEVEIRMFKLDFITSI